MLFRYLTAVPFEDHGSPIENFEGTVSPEGTFSARVVPSAKITRLDFELLRDVYRRIPCELGLPEASLELDEQSNRVTYSGIPTPQTCLTILRDDQGTRESWVRNRTRSAAAVIYAVQALDSALLDGENLRVRQATIKAISLVQSTASALFTTALFDELAFQRALMISATRDDPQARNEILSRVLTSRASQRFTDMPAKIRNQKRLIIPSVIRYVLPPDGPGGQIPLQFTSKTTRLLGEDAIEDLRFAHMIFDYSEQLTIFWGSVISSLSCALTFLLDNDNNEHVPASPDLKALFHSKEKLS